MSRGFMYIAVGDKYLDEAIYSASKLRESMPDTNIAVVTDQVTDSKVFDDVIPAECTSGWRVKIKNMKKYPYENTIFLDTDVFVIDDISELFDLFDRTDVFCAPLQNQSLRESYSKDVPDVFPEFNTGVIGFKKSERVDTLLSMWEARYDEAHSHDQIAFRKAVYDSEIAYHSLPIEYNFRFPEPGHVNHKVKVFHMRPKHVDFATAEYERFIEKLERKINNKTDRPRAYIGTFSEEPIVLEWYRPYIRYWEEFSPSYLQRLKLSLKRDGLLGTGKRMVRKLGV